MEWFSNCVAASAMPWIAAYSGVERKPLVLQISELPTGPSRLWIIAAGRTENVLLDQGQKTISDAARQHEPQRLRFCATRSPRTRQPAISCLFSGRQPALTSS